MDRYELELKIIAYALCVLVTLFQKKLKNKYIQNEQNGARFFID